MDVDRGVVVRAALSSLSVNQLAVVYLHYWEDATLEQVAVLLGVSIGTVRSHLDRAKRMARAGAWRSATLLAVLTAAAGLVAIAAVAVIRDDDAPGASAPADDLPYLLPASLPEGWTLVEARQSDQGALAGFDPSLRALYSREDPAGRIEIAARPMDADQFHTSEENTLSISTGVAAWTSVQSEERAGISVEAFRDGFVIEAVAWGWPSGDESVTRLLEQIAIDAAGRPVLDPASGFSIDAISPDPASRVLENYFLAYGEAGSDDARLNIQVERLDRPLDVRFHAGVFAEPTQVDGLAFWLDDGGHSAVWMAAPDVRVSVFGLINAADEVLRLRDVTATEFTDATGLERLP